MRIGAIFVIAALTNGQLASILACINTSYSGEFESQLTTDAARLIVGQFAHHGTAFYDAELKRTDAVLATNLEDFEALNDHAAAQIKLGAYQAAKDELQALEARFPNRYKVHANFGVSLQEDRRI